MNSETENYLEDRSLVTKVLGGDNYAFGIIIKNTEGLVAMIVFKMIPNAYDRKDIAQDIYLKVFNRLSGFRFQCKLSTWIGQIAYNTCLHYLEKKKLVLPGNNGEEGETLNTYHNRLKGAFAHDAETTVFKKELSGILRDEIEKLPPVYKTLVSLYHQQELSYDEINQITGLPAGTVKNYLFRARKLLKENILGSYKKDDL
ncbi:sigma-70 family RNA polymerase sigma factor [Mucilaginibacter sp.]|uniref:RNA polymerase sigma factor n=1 Tax=Mucilaginibacter sp. TaxID=1882438 RepID=UPI0025F49634|nr:sigma-70 family RNA polymerase sigma factor [Mucilaginibacter sp.]